MDRPPERQAHPTHGKRGRPDEAVLLDALFDWAPDERTRNRILSDNPAELYGFGFTAKNERNI